MERDAVTPASTPSQRTKGESAAKIEDFGEKLEGARKDTWAGYADRMKDAEDVDIHAEPLSKSWPAPDYEKLIAEGIDPWTVAFIRVARDSIPTKPQKSWRLKGWAADVTTLRNFARKLMDGIYTKEDILNARSGAFRERETIELYLAVGHGKSLKGLHLAAARYSVLNGVRHDPPLVRWEVTAKQKATSFSNMPRVLAHAATKAEAIEAFKKVYDALDAAPAKAKKGPKLIIYSRDGRKTWHVGVKIGSNHIDLRSADNVAEARRMIAEEADAIIEQLNRMRDTPRERRDENQPRVGGDHRSGGDVGPEQFSEAFGFRGVQFGNWVEGDRRQQDLNQAYDALMDLAGILDIPPRALSLNGTLGLAFGARGSGGANAAAAHYEPGTVVINLTKKQGAGSLAHEWFHAADNYFARQRTDRKGAESYITDNYAPGSKVEGVRPEVVDA
ncbi:MAG: hypothetical protein KDJ82_15915, partial [Rhodobacteraceae bacterium]|nr:hypothetical protein [Paracoccaceae bacterium]